MDQLKVDLAEFEKKHPGWKIGEIQENAVFSGFLSNPGGANVATHRVVVRDPDGVETVFAFSNTQVSQVPLWLTELVFEHEQGF